MREKCDGCKSQFIHRLGTIRHPKFSEIGYMECSRCGLVMPWHLDEGQKPLVGSSRDKDDPVKNITN